MTNKKKDRIFSKEFEEDYDGFKKTFNENKKVLDALGEVGNDLNIITYCTFYLYGDALGQCQKYGGLCKDISKEECNFKAKIQNTDDNFKREKNYIIPEEEIDIIMIELETYIPSKDFDAIRKILVRHSLFRNFEEKLILEFTKGIDDIIKAIEYENKNGSWNEDIKKNTKDKRYWKGYRYGILSILTDYLIPEKDKYKGKLKEMEKR